jgi:hypothetical protein
MAVTAPGEDFNAEAQRERRDRRERERERDREREKKKTIYPLSLFSPAFPP